jgi:hypothetical protein
VTGGKLVVTGVAPLLVGMAAAHGLGPFDPAELATTRVPGREGRPG